MQYTWSRFSSSSPLVLSEHSTFLNNLPPDDLLNNMHRPFLQEGRFPPPPPLSGKHGRINLVLCVL
jgi:hypothetical protein